MSKLDKYEADLAECYRLTGADPDGNSDEALAGHAVAEVRRLRKESDRDSDQLINLLKIIDDLYDYWVSLGHAIAEVRRLRKESDRDSEKIINTLEIIDDLYDYWVPLGHSGYLRDTDKSREILLRLWEMRR